MALASVAMSRRYVTVWGRFGKMTRIIPMTWLIGVVWCRLSNFNNVDAAQRAGGGGSVKVLGARGGVVHRFHLAGGLADPEKLRQ